MSGPMSKASKSATFPEPGRTWLDTGTMRSNSVHGRFPYRMAHPCLSFPLPVYPASLKPEVGFGPLPIFAPQI
jgi:hypothetical protein